MGCKVLELNEEVDLVEAVKQVEEVELVVEVEEVKPVVEDEVRVLDTEAREAPVSRGGQANLTAGLTPKVRWSKSYEMILLGMMAVKTMQALQVKVRTLVMN
jgi:hypothetical protein